MSFARSFLVSLELWLTMEVLISCFHHNCFRVNVMLELGLQPASVTCLWKAQRAVYCLTVAAPAFSAFRNGALQARRACHE
jgi:hypothetical protein